MRELFLLNPPKSRSAEELRLNRDPREARFDADKLRWLNHEHMKRLAADELGRRLRPFLERAGLDLANGPPVEEVATLLRDRAPTLVEMADAAHYFQAQSGGKTAQTAASSGPGK